MEHLRDLSEVCKCSFLAAHSYYLRWSHHKLLLLPSHHLRILVSHNTEHSLEQFVIKIITIRSSPGVSAIISFVFLLLILFKFINIDFFRLFSFFLLFNPEVVIQYVIHFHSICIITLFRFIFVRKGVFYIIEILQTFPTLFLFLFLSTEGFQVDVINVHIIFALVLVEHYFFLFFFIHGRGFFLFLEVRSKVGSSSVILTVSF